MLSQESTCWLALVGLLPGLFLPLRYRERAARTHGRDMAAAAIGRPPGRRTGHAASRSFAGPSGGLLDSRRPGRGLSAPGHLGRQPNPRRVERHVLEVSAGRRVDRSGRRAQRGEPEQTAILMAHGGRGSASSEVSRLLGESQGDLEANWTYAQAPTFLFGLLERFDVKQLAALVTPDP